MPIAILAERNAMATHYGVDAVYAALFTADPGTSGTVVGEVAGGSPAYARKAISWGTASASAVVGTVTFDVPTGTTITFAGVCSALTGSNLLDKVSITNQTFATQGTYVLTLTFTIT